MFLGFGLVVLLMEKDNRFRRGVIKYFSNVLNNCKVIVAIGCFFFFMVMFLVEFVFCVFLGFC